MRLSGVVPGITRPRRSVSLAPRAGSGRGAHHCEFFRWCDEHCPVRVGCCHARILDECFDGIWRAGTDG